MAKNLRTPFFFSNFYNKYGISHEFSSPKTPQQNSMVEMKNLTLQENGTCYVE